ncbi:hypothetical protein EDC18_103162 [Natranaerovirga pectinivora]|uniref:Multicomponent Na+:H+ antiporter subunit B n=1 Tax=Natranaerovirga pectinivora TaxID=682400 RepID=A0A4R3MRP6_9FIRM|nr:hypothetical protein [Natranaerovirga pectinivora]TCT15457.1 hypothetical protein EDC18_103162 [Natranaerovirga pectinivora]
MKWETFRKQAMIIILSCFVFFVIKTEEPSHSFDISNSYIENSVKETGAINAATAIYLDYRVYDSLFESLLLLICAVGIHHFNKEEKEGGH